MQDHKRATILGLPTYGKGSIQTFYDLDDGSGLKLTTARYLTPLGRSLEGGGITPDVTVDSFEAEVIVAGAGATGDDGAVGEGEPVSDDADAGATAENDARIREELVEDHQFQVALQTVRGWLRTK